MQPPDSIVRTGFPARYQNEKAKRCAVHPAPVGSGPRATGLFEIESLEIVIEDLPEYLRGFVRCDHLIVWRKGSLKSLRCSVVGDDVIYLQAKSSKTRKPESVPLEGELGEIIGRRRAASVWQSGDGQAHFSEYVFHNQGEPVLIGNICDAYLDGSGSLNDGHS